MIDVNAIHIHGELKPSKEDELPTNTAVFDFFDRIDVESITWENE